MRKYGVWIVVAALLAATGTVIGAQALVPPPPLPYGAAISAENAKKVAAAAIAFAQKNNFKMAIAVVDAAGYLVYFERMPDAQLGSIDLAIQKAKSAVMFRRSTKAFEDALAAGGSGWRILGLSGVVPVAGGEPLVVDGKIVGGVGASGGNDEQDGEAAVAGVAGTPK